MGEEYTPRFLLSCGLSQSVVDRRVFYQHGKDGTLMVVAVYVDDSWRISTCAKMRDDLDRKWKAEYDLSSDVEDTAGDFCGVKIVQHRGEGEDGRVELTCPRLYGDMEEKLRGHPLPAGFKCTFPMSHDGPKLIMEPESEANPLMSEEMKSIAQSILGLGGFIVSNVRPDAYFAFCTLSQCVGHHFTKNVWKALLSWAYYLLGGDEGCEADLSSGGRCHVVDAL